MLSDDQLLTILSKIIEKSKAGKVHWNRSPKGEYTVRFSDGTMVSVRYHSPPSSPDIAIATLTSRDGEVLHCVAQEDGESYYPFLREAVSEAYRATTGWDSTLARVMEELESDKEIGEAPPTF